MRVEWLTCNSHCLCQTERDRLPICIMKLCHSLRVTVNLGQEHALAAGTTQQAESCKGRMRSTDHRFKKKKKQNKIIYEAKSMQKKGRWTNPMFTVAYWDTCLQMHIWDTVKTSTKQVISQNTVTIVCVYIYVGSSDTRWQNTGACFMNKSC